MMKTTILMKFTTATASVDPKRSYRSPFLLADRAVIAGMSTYLVLLSPVGFVKVFVRQHFFVIH